MIHSVICVRLLYLDHMTNPYEASPQLDGRTMVYRQQLKRFRWHAISAIVVGCFLAGNRHEISSPGDIPWVVGLSICMVWGPWLPPINLLYWIVVPVAVISVQAAKQSRPAQYQLLVQLQIGIWWSFWMLFGFAERFGRYVGP